MDVHVTERGLQRIHFTDSKGKAGILEQSTDLDYENPSDEPNSSYLLLGRKEAPLQLSIEQVGELVERLQEWLEDGRFAAAAKAQGSRDSARLSA